MELNTVLFAGIGAGVVVGMLLGIGLMCWLVMARNDPISAEEDPDTHAQLPGWSPLPEEVGQCAHQGEPRGCSRVRCQLGRKCVNDDLANKALAHPKEWGEHA